jgi:membrane-bound lytic murein transglycosylase D
MVHRVRRGETLSTIARRYGTSVRAIMAHNGLTSSHYVRAGWKLKIPTKASRASSQQPPKLVTVSTSDGKVYTYTVRRGDSLWRIANRYGTTTKAIQTLNHLRSSDLQIGQVLKIPQEMGGHEQIATKPYTVSRGDSPFKIAQRHNMNLSHFLSLNHLTPRSTIYPGQVLLVRAK